MGWGEKIQHLTHADIDRLFREWEQRVASKDRWFSEASFQFSDNGEHRELKVTRCLTDPALGYLVLHTTTDGTQCRTLESGAAEGTVEVEDSANDAHVVKRSYMVAEEVAKQAVHYFSKTGREDPSLNWVTYEEVDPQYISSEHVT